MARPTLSKHRKFQRLAHVLGSPITARGALELLWDVAYESGDDYMGTAQDIERVIGWTGAPGALVDALAGCGSPEGHGFIEPIDDAGATDVTARYRVHDLYQHAPDYVQHRRYRESERKIVKVCNACGREYYTADGRSTTCSNACRQTAYRRRLSGVTRAPGNGHGNGRVTSRLRGVAKSSSTTAPAPAPGTKKRKNAAGPHSQSQPVEKSPPDVAVLAAMIRADVLPLHLSDPADVVEAAKSRAAKLRLPYDGRSIASAIASARAQAEKAEA